MPKQDEAKVKQVNGNGNGKKPMLTTCGMEKYRESPRTGSWKIYGEKYFECKTHEYI